MNRTVVYPSAAPSPMSPSAAESPDDYADKLVKYIPAEVLAFFLPAYTVAGKLQQPDLVRWLVFGSAVLGGVGYLLIRAESPKPRWYFYVCATVAFAAWAVGTTAVGLDLFGLQEHEISGKLILMGAVFLVPLADELLTRYLPRARP